VSNAIRIHETGGPEVLRWEHCKPPALRPDQALVEHRAVGVNYIDTYHRSGLYKLPALPAGIGVEAAGIVRSVGSEVRDVAPGDRVAYVSRTPGAYAEFGVQEAARLVRLPAALDFETAAAVLLKGMTAETLIRRVYPVKAGQTVLLHAAAGGVGIIACQWLRELGARVLATVGSDEKAELARAHGAAETIVYSREDFVARVRELTAGAGVPVVFDSVGKATLARSLECLSPRGTLVTFGNASGNPDAVEVSSLAAHGSLFLTRPVLFDYIASRDELLACANAVFEVVARGNVEVRVGQRFALADAKLAHEALESRKTSGSTLLIPG
jgi:NADPH2:quinone reductase